MRTTTEKIDWEAVKQRLAQSQAQTHDYGCVDANRLAEVFHERAERLAQRGRLDASRQTRVPVLVVRLGNERFGIELSHVKRIFQRAPITPIPGTAEHLVGVANLNGNLRSIISLSRLLKLSDTQADAGFVVLVDVGEKSLGVSVDGLEHVCPIDLNNLTPIDATTADATAGYLKGMTDDGIIVLDVAGLIEHIVKQSVRHIEKP